MTCVFYVVVAGVVGCHAQRGFFAGVYVQHSVMVYSRRARGRTGSELCGRMIGRDGEGGCAVSVIERAVGSVPLPAARRGRRDDVARWHRPARIAGQIALEAGLATAAFGLAYQARYVLQLGGAVDLSNQQPFTIYSSYAALLIGAILLLFGVRGLYRLPRGTSYLSEVTLMAEAVTVANAVVLVVVFLSPELVSSRLFVIYAWAGIILTLAAERGMRRIVRDWLWQRGIGVERALVVGSGLTAERVISYLSMRNSLGFRLVGFIDDIATPDDWPIATSQGTVRPAHLGRSEDLVRIVAEHGVSEVVIALPPDAHERNLRVIEACRAADVRFQLVPDVFALSLGRVQINELNGVPLIAVRDNRIRGWNLAIKRAVDIIGALIALAIVGLPMLLIAAVIKIESRGPAIFKQKRIGKDGEPFWCYKFRSMIHNAEQQQSELEVAFQVDQRLSKVKDDQRRTQVGRFIRRTSLDELPQLLNVLIGKMSLVGPRPQVLREVQHYEPWHLQRLTVLPGITGIWQVSGRSDLTFDEMVRLDIYYAEHWSVRLDLEILLRTIPAVLSQRGAY